MLRRRSPLPLWLALLGCAVLLAVVATFGVAVGSVPLSPRDVWGVIVDHLRGRSCSSTSTADSIVWEIRLPRVLLAVELVKAVCRWATVHDRSRSRSSKAVIRPAGCMNDADKSPPERPSPFPVHPPSVKSRWFGRSVPMRRTRSIKRRDTTCGGC